MLRQSYDTPILVVMFATGCKFCKKARPILNRFAAEWVNGRVGYFYDSERFGHKHFRAKDEYPAYMLFRHGGVVHRHYGMFEADELKRFVGA
jgi:thiol-disulfide isomerase/thioredoxin